jgi:hypothetical protein
VGERYENTTTRTNYRQRNARSEVGVPLLWSLVSGLVIIVVLGAWFALAHLPLQIAALIGGTVFAGLWFTVGAWVWRDEERVASIEQFARVDPDGDGVVGKPEPQREWATPVRLPVEQGKSTKHLDVTVTPQLQAFCTAYLTRRERRFSEQGARRFGCEAEFRTMRDAMIKAGLLSWKNEAHHNQGVDWHEGAIPALRHIRDHSPTREGEAA